MPLKNPIPKAAMPVVRALRRDVPRPEHLPFKYQPSCALRWPRFICPMGLHPKATDRVPMTKDDFPICSEKAIVAFYCWWDAQTDAKAATDAVWPKKKKRKSKMETQS